MKIGIGITTRNRREIAEKSIREIRKFAPKGSKIIVVDDASDDPYYRADYRFPFQAGIAKAKNKCLELLKDCDYLFLFDDDCFPVKEGWAEAYINTGLNHASFNFVWRGDGMHIVDHLPNNVTSWSSPRGCMMFFTKKALEVAGGMDEGFAIWGYEHPEYSRRCWLLKINPCPFPDIKGSEEYFYSYDMHSNIVTTVLDRTALIDYNRDRYMKSEAFPRFIPFIKNDIPLKPVILTSYFNGAKDPQRGYYWGGNLGEIRGLIDTCQNTNTPLIVFHDCFDQVKDFGNVHFRRVAKNPKKSPLSYRWLIYRDYLEKNHHTKFFCVDSTDIKLLRNPFSYMENGKLYIGDEWNNTWVNVWVEKYNEPFIKIKDYTKVKEANADKPLLNAGIVGGDFEYAFGLIDRLADQILREPNDPTVHTDMALVNYLARKFYPEVLRHGDPVNTRFKQFEEYHHSAWFQHK
jgi:glycosyltransferase involved in cell wall biosynthesis